MANMSYIMPNRLEAQISRREDHHAGEMSRYRDYFGIVFLIVLLVVLIAAPMATVGVVIFGALCYLFFRPIKCDTVRKETGLNGEEKALAALADLPDDYTVFNQVELPGMEADFVVIGPNGLFVVENKEYHGDLAGGPDGKWSKGRGTATNPVSQVMRHTILLRAHFEKCGIKQWITPIVSLSTCNSTTNIFSPKVPVVGVWDVPDVIKSWQGTVSAAAGGRIVNCLVGLRN